MNRKITISAIFVIFMLVAITMVSAHNTTNPIEKKGSPLFEIRASNSIKEKTTQKMNVKSIIANFLKGRIFFIKLDFVSPKSNPHTLNYPTCPLHTGCPGPTCTFRKQCDK